MKFDIVWEDCMQEETRVANREDLLKEDGQALATHTRRGRIQSIFKKWSHKEYQPPKGFQKKRENSQKKDYSQYQCYNCHIIWHISKECPLNNKNNKIHHAHLTKYEDEEEEERPWKLQAKEENIEEYVLFSTLSGSVIPGEDTCIIDSGASNHMKGHKKTM